MLVLQLEVRRHYQDFVHLDGEGACVYRAACDRSRTSTVGQKNQTQRCTTSGRCSTSASQAVKRILKEIPTPLEHDDYWGQESADKSTSSESCPVAICTGGGPGLMEAANKGAAAVAGARSMGVGISLPLEPGLNTYVAEELSFEFHYFFTRKFWMVYSALAVIAAPGGVGTLDELMEVLTLKQTKKMKRDIPVVLFGKKYWDVSSPKAGADTYAYRGALLQFPSFSHAPG